MEQIIGEAKAWELMGWHTDSLPHKAKAKAHKLSKGRNSFPTSHWLTDAQLLSAESLYVMFSGGNKFHHYKCPLSPFFPPAFIAESDAMFSEMPWWPIWVSYPGCVPSQALVHFQPNADQAWEVWEVLSLCKHCSATLKTTVCYHHCFH